MLENLRKPEYLFRPIQIFHRLRRGRRAPAAEFETVRLPWGLPLRIRPNETIGRLIWTFGVFELPVTELLWRLADPGETAVDVGGNIGYMSSLLAARVGPSGRVLTYEPHPEVFEDLVLNVAEWRRHAGLEQVVPIPVAVGEESGVAALATAPSFDGNRGLAWIDPNGQSGDCTSVKVPVQSLDRHLDGAGQVGVLKIDVEGYEHAVLAGAREMLAAGVIRDIVFEDHTPYPSPAAASLEELGYTVFAVGTGVRGPVLRPAAEGDDVPLRPWETRNYLATRSPDRAWRRLRRPGWKALAGRAPAA